MQLDKRTLPTIEDVAQRAGVSTATVSRCLNEPNKVTQKSRDKVMKAVEALHYTPNFGARAIAANRTGTFAAIIPTMENAIFARGIEAFQQTLAENNATTLVASSAYDPQQEAILARTMVARGADGLLLIGTEREPDIYNFLRQRNIPFVIAWAISDNPQVSFVGFDNRQASRDLVTTAIDAGHQHFAYISAQVAGNDRARERVNGARDALNDKGLDAASMAVIETAYSVHSGNKAFKEIMTTSHRPTCVLCGNDVLGVGAIKGAQELGLNVPSDVAVTGFDNIELSRIIAPALTTVDVPHREMGKRAAEALLQLIRAPSNPIRITLKTSIVPRASL